MGASYIKIGKEHYRLADITFDNAKAQRTARRYRKDGSLVRVIKKTLKASWGKETSYHVYFSVSTKRKDKRKFD